MPCVQSPPFLSSSSLLVASQKMKTCVPYAMNAPMNGLSRKFEEIKNTPMENIPNKLWEMCPEPVRKFPWKETRERIIKHTYVKDVPIKLWEMCPEPVRNFPWKKARKRVVERFFHLILDAIKWLGITILVVTFFMEASYCVAQNKELIMTIALITGGVFAEILKETSIELELPQINKEGDFPQHLLIIMSVFSLIKILGPFYPYWARIILPHLANGVLCRTIWLGKDYFFQNSSQTTEEENNPGGDSESAIGAKTADS
ncbi:hypothetical protein KI387_009159 [Taxus chinensis]|uniref:Uncharacterized protein n=1 Tax=Taxus chinensis TaxID=29808 RepID=A0AA38CPX7_TAXCH|nr:hypothetical protein KI387_009159 [Taxus chinensis]